MRQKVWLTYKQKKNNKPGGFEDLEECEGILTQKSKNNGCDLFGFGVAKTLNG